jgi:hypothetical protein
MEVATGRQRDSTAGPWYPMRLEPGV